MKATEDQRRSLFERIRAHLDAETALLLMEVTVPAPRCAPATQRGHAAANGCGAGAAHHR